MSEPRVLSALRACSRGATATDIARSTALPGLDVIAALYALRDRGIVRIGQRGRWLATEPPAEPATRGMVAGSGERHDECAHYAECLSAVVRSDARGHARCPTACPHYTPVRIVRSDLTRTGRVAGGEW